MVKIVWTEIATNDLKEIFDYIAQDSIRYASITTFKIYHHAQEIRINPFIGRIVPEFNEIKIRELIEGNYRIIYAIKNELQVDVLRIYHSARSLKRKSIQ
ncbi:MAG: type II toxin-antitoxin system RelE/ParE family toxin [Bacteroidota bacterium]|nr:MAG: type II toxin-antitoxin system RelE/ParE family toxin [Bacteroidota bacterium]